MSGIPLWAQAGFWGLVAGGALVLGAVVGYRFDVPRRLIAAIMAFGSGVLISALSFELIADAYERGGFNSMAAGFLGGAAVYTAANWLLSRKGAKHRKRSGGQQPSAAEDSGSGVAIAVGAVSTVAVGAIFLSHVPEGLASAAGMKKAGRSASYVFGIWGGIALASGIASLVGYTVFQDLPPAVVAATTAVAAGAILAMLVDTMIPEAFEVAHDFAGLVTVAGFLAAFALSKLGG